MSRIAWAVIILVGVLVLLAVGAGLLLPFWARGAAFGVRPFVGGFGIAWPFLIMRGLGSLLFWVLIIAGIFLIIRSIAGRPYTSTPASVAAESPLDILKRRYANGDINKEQYEEMRSTLGG